MTNPFSDMEDRLESLRRESLEDMQDECGSAAMHIREVIAYAESAGARIPAKQLEAAAQTLDKLRNCSR